MSNQIDKIVYAKLSSLNIKPLLCSDEVFVRRVYLDVIGTLPTAEEAWKFINNPDKRNKRRILIDRLLERAVDDRQALARKSPVSAATPDLDSEAREQLRELGYLGDEDGT